jgi:hypothetical protein
MEPTRSGLTWYLTELCTHRRCSAAAADVAHSLSLHDKDRDFTRPDYHIVTISLGATRELQLVKVSDKTTTNFDMLHGSCYVLNRATNVAWRHGVPPTGRRSPCGFRIGLTYRTVATRFDSSTNEIIHANGRRERVPDEADAEETEEAKCDGDAHRRAQEEGGG